MRALTLAIADDPLAAAPLCQFSAEGVWTGTIIRPDWPDLPHHPGVLAWFGGSILLLGSGVFLVIAGLRRLPARLDPPSLRPAGCWPANARIDKGASVPWVARMVATRPSGLRFILAATLMLILALTGVGRGFVAVASEASDSLAGVTVPICHTGRGEASIPSDPAHPVQHGCCDACALLAPTVLPSAPVLTKPAAVERHADHAAALAWSPHLARLRGPRLSRGPPSA